MFGIILILLRAIGMGCVMTVINKHVAMESWEGMLLAFGTMMILGTLYDVSK